MSGDPQQTLGALLARLEVRDRQIAVEAEAAHEQIAQLTALLDGLAQATEHITITRKTLLELPDETPPGTGHTDSGPAGRPRLPADHGRVRRSRRSATARNVCEAMDLDLRGQCVAHSGCSLGAVTG